MVRRQFWVDRIEKAWQSRRIVWLSGVRRAGKTMLCQSLSDIEYFDCELPRIRHLMEDPEGFLSTLPKSRIVLDEVHRLPNPSELLKIAADHFPHIQLLATGSSMLSASNKFKDTLAGRKVELWLTPMIYTDLADFERLDIGPRLLKGGLPPFFLADNLPERDFQEWIDSYWSKDIQELFRLERRTSFQKFLELLLVQSGGIFEAQSFAQPCEVSRPTIHNYLNVMEVTRIAHIVRPFSSHRANEIIAAPKVFGFDTGFVCYFRGWHNVHEEDKGTLWEHIVLNELQAQMQGLSDIKYWRDKRGHEIDFVLKRRGDPPIAIECKWSAKQFESRSLESFRKIYKTGENWVIATDIDRPFTKVFKELSVEFFGLGNLSERLQMKDHPQKSTIRSGVEP